MSIDPLWGKTPIVSSYAYANDNPLRLTDLTGLQDMLTRKRSYIILSCCLSMLIGCAKEKDCIPVPRGLLNGDTVYVGENLDALQKSRQVETDPSGGLFERLPVGNLFQEVGYIIEDEEVVSVMFSGADFQRGKNEFLDSLSEICDDAYGDIDTTMRFIQSDGQRFNMRQWCSRGEFCACLIYSADHEGRIADHAVASFEVGCRRTEWERWKKVE